MLCVWSRREKQGEFIRKSRFLLGISAIFAEISQELPKSKRVLFGRLFHICLSHFRNAVYVHLGLEFLDYFIIAGIECIHYLFFSIRCPIPNMVVNRSPWDCKVEFNHLFEVFFVEIIESEKSLCVNYYVAFAL